MTTRRLLRGAALLVTALLLASAAAGCGQRSATDRPGAAAGDAAGSAPASWVLRLESHSGEDGETKQASYLTITPATGAVSTVTMPRLQVAEASGTQEVLLLDAAQQFALADTRPAGADRAAGRVRVVRLASGGARTVDVRRATGDPKLTTDWVSFDATEPGLLRVVDGLTVWTLGVDGRHATKEGVLPSRPGWIFGGGFNKNTGTPYIEDTGSFDTLPRGNGDLDERPVRRDGGRLLFLDNGSFAGLPNPGCGLGQGYLDADGVAWAFCVVGRHVEVRRLSSGGSSWQAFGKPTRDVVPPNADPAYVLPGH